MPVTTTPQAVQDILSPGNDYRPGKPLEPFILVGVKRSSWIQANAANYGLTPNDTETASALAAWIAAWAYKASDQQYQSSNAGRSSATFRGQSGKGLEMNNYGQVAMEMDTTGMLKAANEGRIVGVTWIGKPEFDQLTYDERNL